MIDYETIARRNHLSGMNCAASVYDALGMHNPNKTTPPRPRSIDGKCGAVLAAEQTIREAGGTKSDVEEFEKRFIQKFGHLKCSELLGSVNGKCNDFVGGATAFAAMTGLLHDS